MSFLEAFISITFLTGLLNASLFTILFWKNNVVVNIRANSLPNTEYIGGAQSIIIGFSIGLILGLFWFISIPFLTSCSLWKQRIREISKENKYN